MKYPQRDMACYNGRTGQQVSTINTYRGLFGVLFNTKFFLTGDLAAISKASPPPS
jgi:hypothetical protein